MAITVLETKRFEDERGWFGETYSAEKLRIFGIKDQFVQDNQSVSVAVGTLRGLHFQTPPHAQAKLVRCAADGGIHWNDPVLGINWPLPATGPITSPKDQQLPLLSGLAKSFTYDGIPLSLKRVSL